MTRFYADCKVRETESVGEHSADREFGDVNRVRREWPVELLRAGEASTPLSPVSWVRPTVRGPAHPAPSR